METYSQRFSNPSFALAVEINRLAWKSLEMERQTMLYRINEQAEALSLLRSGYAHSGIVMDEVRLEMEAMEKSPEYLEYVKEAEEHKKALQLQGQLSEVRQDTFIVPCCHCSNFTQINALHDVFCSLKSAKSSGFPPKSEHGPEESDDDNWGLTDYNSDSDE